MPRNMFDVHEKDVTRCSDCLRSLPHSMNHKLQELCYGDCVDFYYMGTWWEGVICDHYHHGSDQRLVFLPESGRKFMAGVKDLRITQDWDERSGIWRRRGAWPLMEEIVKFEKDWQPDVSAGQTWRTIKEKFLEMVCGVKPLWKELVTEILHDLEYQKPDDDFDGSCMNLDSNAALTEFRGVSEERHLFSTVENPSEGEVILKSDSGKPSTDSCVEVGGLVTVTSKFDGKLEDSDCEGIASWLPFEADLVNGAEFCPKAITQYFSLGSKRAPECLLLQVRKHLLYIGWKIERCSYKSSYRYRYFAPIPGERKLYTSLRQVCLDLRDSNMANCFTACSVQKSAANASKESSNRHKLIGRKRKTDADFLVMERLPQRGKKLTSLKNLKEVSEVNQRASRTQRRKRVKKEETSNSSKWTKSINILSLLIDYDVVLPRAKVHCYSSDSRTRVKKGIVTHHGIKCSCCSETFSLGDFEAHAGCTDRRPPANIFLGDGRSLLDCEDELLVFTNGTVSTKCGRKDKHHQAEQSDEICSICHVGGDLILCDQCPSSFHITCLGLEDVPDGEWFCPSCCCQICGHFKCEENVQPSAEVSMLSCDQCLDKYHLRCLKNRADIKMRRENWFCSNICENIHFGLQNLMMNPIQLREGKFTWTLLGCMDSDTGTLDMKTENSCKLNLALKVLHECFEPITDFFTGRDFFQDVVFCRESALSRLNCKGFCTVILEKSEELISVANVRVFGGKIAELPFVATRCNYRGQGMCRIMIDELEKQLMNLGVERLVLPAVPSVLNAWINSFGFSEMTDSDREQCSDHSLIYFEGAVMCHKFLKKPH
ncbi:hypothetical protein K2173_023377 [Erythroxylum novogranatense]|uniref:PHD finger transcription factor n=1 Tax=Erythroxylum novogranatense TaxID=1862640 RepID=A0AAV8TVI2_9ROSI|nr:hypothetical protein K2173_023377 [Erythroxylum novogranatense]